ncbi:hypothetical protein F383_03283 [Gossypium arboreum]|uniref:Uncharacterized protein n=1 Tax=Gossypium arboreum TaxID=29729 RepID=A0A0B0P305_GOSAR|nr:hypothetical protein F383_03283 [Gossypium arboreum]
MTLGFKDTMQDHAKAWQLVRFLRDTM